MEDSFSVRVDKVFGSLLSSSNPRSLWSLTDDEIERREWNRDKGSSEPEMELGGESNEVTDENPVDFHKEMEKDLEELGDDDGDLGFESRDSRASSRPDDYNEEEWEVKSNIGMDCTLDFEEEVDEYDQVATGKEIDSRMNDYIDDYGIEDDSCNELPNSIKDIIRDPRANHVAAKLRLKEDAEAAEKINSLPVIENGASLVDPQINAPEDGNLKSILKKRDTQAELKSHKRVRFDSECRKECVENSEGAKQRHMETCLTEKIDNSTEATLLPQDHPSGIPDYIRNPSKYTHYTFDPSDDLDEKNNQQAYMDFLKLVDRSNTVDSQPDNTSDGPLKSVSFIPKKKIDHVMMLDNGTESKQNKAATGKEFEQRSSLAVGIAVWDTLDGEVCAMDEEDEQDVAVDGRSNSKRSGRQYRTKARLELEQP
ncbi:hypothetical protein HS088_TW23G00314 [Tripterygium wilfordii]|uniref:U5 small nuclear ribonucleoprotein TSSC4 n=1 Tax=Tripterygium wilfordii TaxID=458696 RepID=A0A7J7BUK8_TRIWF|nr:uncharacterized protein LOC119993877 [Tripterygium wilfordii]KAF5725590.1 hypothetical protein HS088_TW23G00314 [Tripterygium wilfordii]